MIREQVLAEDTIPNGRDDLVALVTRAQTGDATAFAFIYRLHVNQVYAFAARRLPNRDAAEEATQEIFTRAMEGLHRCQNQEAFSGWLFGIANHVVHSHYKARKTATETIDLITEPIDRAPGPEDHALSNATASEIRTAREWCLTDAERTLFDLILAELSDKQIAAALGRRQGSVRTARWRLLSKLRGCMTMPSQHPAIPHVPV